MMPGFFFFASLLLLGGSRDSANRDDLRFLAPLVNLGELRTYVARIHRFEFVNQSSQPVEIISVEPSCGCMVVNLPKRRFQPGEKGELILQLRPTSQTTGPHTWFAKVQCRSGERESIVRLQVQAVIRREVSVAPGVLSWIGSGEFKHEVTVTDVRQPPLAVTAVHFTSPLVNAEVVSSSKGQTRILLQSTAVIPPGRHDEILSIYTNDSGYAHLQVPVTLEGQVKRAVAATPETVEVRIENGQTSTSHVRLRPLIDGGLKIVAVTADHPAVSCSFTQGPFGTAMLRI